LENITVFNDFLFEVIKELLGSSLLFGERFLDKQVSLCKSGFESLPSFINGG
jgi:hypothetical protein